MIKKWGTYDGRVVKMEDIEHQHLSNIYFYINFIIPKQYTNEDRKDIMFWLRKRFNGELLMYSPVLEFKSEIQYLHKLHYIKSNGYIVVDGKIIGKLKV